MRRTIRRLTFISDAPHFGGAERYIVDMARAALRRGIRPHVHWMRSPTGDADVFCGDRLPDLTISASAPAATATLRGLSREFAAMLSDARPDALVVNACGRPRFWAIPWLARRWGLPVVWVQQMVDGHDHRQIRPRRLGGRIEGPQWWRVPQTIRHRLAAAAATSVVTLNTKDRERIIRWQGVSRDKVRVIPHGVDCEHFRFDNAGRERLRRAWGIDGCSGHEVFAVGTAGRLVTGKRVDILLDAVAILRRSGMPAVAIVAGQGPERDRLGRRSSDLGIRDAVRFLDFVSDMPAFYSALDAFVLCSDTESFGLALAEAMACERPVAATPTAGSSRQIQHERNGWQLETFDPRELATALATMCTGSHLRHRWGTAGRDGVIRHFSIDLTLERTLRALCGRARERSTLQWPAMHEMPYVSMAAEDFA